MTEDVRSLVIRSSAVNFVASFLLKGLVLVQTVAYARIFSPTELGQVSTVILVVSFATLFSRMGFDESIVRENRDPETVMNTALTISLVMGLSLFALLNLGAPFVARVFHRAELEAYTRLLSFFVFATPLGLPNALWVRRFRFDREKAASYSDLLVATGVTLGLHFGTSLGIWSLFVGRLAGFAANYATVWLLAAYRPRFAFDRSQAKALYRFGWPVVVIGLANYLMLQGDDVLVRYFWGDASLAYYLLAYSFPYYLREATDVLLGALLPSFSRLRDSKERLTSAFVESNKYITHAIAPIGFFLAAAARPIVLVVFGEKWAPAIEPMSLLALGFTIQVMWGYGWGMLCLAWGKTRYLMYVKLWIVFYLATVGILLIRAHGPMGGATYYVTQSILTVGVVRFWILKRELGSLAFLKDSWKPVVAGVLPGALLWLAGPSITTAPALLLAGLGYLAGYVLLTVALDPGIVRESKQILGTLVRRA
ncbi:MAG: oligosaccharide flippase family protein [Candidatus Latescibacteria bacterium]|nr:oligosaccharide flippase family protein [Candidatus Latescibacterota bacterium]